ncbi:hypothetical protein MRX96_039793 [Rhipicephalus microplus]
MLRKTTKRTLLASLKPRPRANPQIQARTVIRAKKRTRKKRRKKCPLVSRIPVNLPWQGHEYEYEEQIRPDGSRVGTYHYKGLGGAPKYPGRPRDNKGPAEVFRRSTIQGARGLRNYYNSDESGWTGVLAA